jgi:phosphohistidine phosphatase SixA
LETSKHLFEILVRGLKTARLTGRAMVSNNLVADICLSSNALRCVQTCERILTGIVEDHRGFSSK